MSAYTDSIYTRFVNWRAMLYAVLHDTPTQILTVIAQDLRQTAERIEAEIESRK